MNSQVDDIKNFIHTEKFQMLNQDQKFVNEILDKYGLEVKWLSDKLNMDYETVRYQLRQAQNYRQDFHSRVVEILKKEGLISNSKEATDKLKDELSEISEVLNRAVALMLRSTKDRLPNGIDAKEKQDLKEIVRTQMNRSIDAYNDLLITIDMQ